MLLNVFFNNDEFSTLTSSFVMYVNYTVQNICSQLSKETFNVENTLNIHDKVIVMHINVITQENRARIWKSDRAVTVHLQ